MLTSLYIKNYALIDELNVQFNNGLTIITGETGAGKSILLGGLSLVLGKRADLSQVKNIEEKCIIEAVFDVVKYKLEALYNKLDIDYEPQTIIRREILPSGKSRAFINDSPVTLDTLSTLSTSLIDIHSQHQTLQLTQDSFQLKVIDALADNKKNIDLFTKQLTAYKELQKSLALMIASKEEMLKEYDYNLFLVNELKAIELESINIQNLEEQYEALNNVETIGEKLESAKSILNSDAIGVIEQLNTIRQELLKISSFGNSYKEVQERVDSVSIELDDLLIEIEKLQDDLISDPQELEKISNTLQLVNNLLHKHSVSEIEDLVKIREALSEKLNTTDSLDDSILEKENELKESLEQLNAAALKIRANRNNVIAIFISKIETIVSDLGMPNAKFKIELEALDDFVSNGKDKLHFLFAANKGSNFNELKKTASGGELSRIMLAVKSILSEYIQLPSIMFDEIDTGVSGEISDKMGVIMKHMSKTMQVFTITHLPQIAAKGHTHFKVFKTDDAEKNAYKLKTFK